MLTMNSVKILHAVRLAITATTELLVTAAATTTSITTTASAYGSRLENVAQNG